jgi:biopolymer transport protein ExbD
MAKIKLPVRIPRIDMTPMVDLFCLLLTFFMLTTTFRPQEAVQVDTPSSISQKITPEKNVITILVSKDSKVYFNIDNGMDTSKHVRKDVLVNVGKQYNVTFTPAQLTKFEKMNSFGMPITKVGEWIDNSTNSELVSKLQTGIPIDSLDNQLAMWVHFSRLANPEAEAAIKGDGEADYKVVKKVLDVMQDKKINRFNLTTNLEQVTVQLDNK